MGELWLMTDESSCRVDGWHRLASSPTGVTESQEVFLYSTQLLSNYWGPPHKISQTTDAPRRERGEALGPGEPLVCRDRYGSRVRSHDT